MLNLSGRNSPTMQKEAKLKFLDTFNDTFNFHSKAFKLRKMT